MAICPLLDTLDVLDDGSLRCSSAFVDLYRGNPELVAQAAVFIMTFGKSDIKYIWKILNKI